MLHQSLIVAKWIDSFNSYNVNDLFTVIQKEGFPEISHNLNMQFVDAMSEVKYMKLSPNLKLLNKALITTKDQLNISIAGQLETRSKSII